MGIFRRWRNWFRWHVWLELWQRWHCWRHGVVRLAEAVCVRSVTISGQELLLGPLPGALFNEASDQQRCYGTNRIAPGALIEIEVENLTNRAVPFQGAVFVTERQTWSSTVYPFPPTVLPPRQSARFAVRATAMGELQRLFIPTHVKRS